MSTTQTQEVPERSAAQSPPEPPPPEPPPHELPDEPSRCGDIYALMSNVMAEVGAVGKNQRNDYHGYAYRGIDDLYNAVHPALVKHGIWCAPEVRDKHIQYIEASTDGDRKPKTKVHVILTVAFRWYAADGSSVETVTLGEAMDSGDRACSKAMTDAYKKALFQTLCIPIEEINFDPEQVSHEVEDGPKPRLTNGAGKPVDPPAPPPAEHPRRRKDLDRLARLYCTLYPQAKGYDKEHVSNWLNFFGTHDDTTYKRLEDLPEKHVTAICKKVQAEMDARKD